jgi:ArsR family transcriptional regulator
MGRFRHDRKYSLERLYRALADPTRLRLINLMADQEMCVRHLVGVMNMPQPKVSHHLAYLRRAGIVSARRDGNWVHYRLAVSGDSNVEAIVKVTLVALKKDPKLQRDLHRLGLVPNRRGRLLER